MNTPEERRAEDRRRRTDRQREKRSRDRICGHCTKPATAALSSGLAAANLFVIPICGSAGPGWTATGGLWERRHRFVPYMTPGPALTGIGETFVRRTSARDPARLFGSERQVGKNPQS